VDFEKVHEFRGGCDKKFVSTFWQHAEEIFAAAEQGGPEDCEWSILMSRDGGIHMLSGAEWELEPLRLHHGARAAYHVSRRGGGVRVEARSANESCVLEARRPVRLPGLVPDFPRYLTIP